MNSFNLLAWMKSKFLYAVIFLISFTLFFFYLQKNILTFYYDEIRYFDLATAYLQKGLFYIGSDVPFRDFTTYLYPFMIATIRVLFSSKFEHIKGLFSILQYLIFLATVCYIAITTLRVTEKKNVVIPILAAGLLNMYMIQASTLFLTDLISACLVIFSIYATVLSDLNRKKNVFASIGLSFINLMIRPSSLIFVFITFAIILYRFIRKDFQLNKSFIITIIFCLIFFVPQVFNNVINYKVWSPLVAVNLYESQRSWAVQMLKYGTVVINGENPGLIFHNPFATNPSPSYFELLGNNFLIFLYVTFIHIFAVIDWGYVDTYIRNFYPISRFFGSVELYISWFFSCFGIYFVFIQDYRNKINSSFLSSKPNFFYTCLFLSAVVYMAFIATTAPEARFGYPILLLLLPFLGYGAAEGIQQFRIIPGKVMKIRKVFLLSSAVVLTIIVLFALSFALDQTTGRIYWTSYFKHQIYAVEAKLNINLLK